MKVQVVNPDSIIQNAFIFRHTEHCLLLVVDVSDSSVQMGCYGNFTEEENEVGCSFFFQDSMSEFEPIGLNSVSLIAESKKDEEVVNDWTLFHRDCRRQHEIILLPRTLVYGDEV